MKPTRGEMSRRGAAVLATFVFALPLLAAVLPASGASGGPPFVPGQLIIAFEPGVTDAQAADFYRDYDLEEDEDLDSDPGDRDPEESLVDVPETITDALIEQLEGDARVEYAERNYILTADLTPTDPEYGRLWGLDNTGQTGGSPDADIDAPEAWDVTTGSPSVIVGVIDTGVDYNHEDLAANIWTNPGEVPGDGIDNEGNGYIDDVHGINAITGTGNPMDDHGHGTHVSGTIAAVGGNGKGVVGVNWTAQVAACKFLNSSGSGTTADAIECFKYFNRLKNVAGQNIVVTNNSWGGGGFSQALMDAMAGLDQPGIAPILHAAAAGNSNQNNDAIAHYPDGYNLDNIVSVAATDHNDRYASFTNWGVTKVDLAAPGVDICSTWVGTPSRPCGSGGSYHLGSGTSMATPHVAGAVAAVKAVNPSFSATDLKQRILSTVDPIGNLSGNSSKPTVTNGRLNLLDAVKADTIAPAPVADLAAGGPTAASLSLTWTATGDDGTVGRAASYDIRYSTSPITEADWAAAAQVSGEPPPKPPGSPEALTVSGLASGTTYHFAMKVTDNLGNESGLSNPASGTTTQAAPVQTKSYAPTSVTITRGTSLGDPLTNLTTDDGIYYQVGSLRRGNSGKHLVLWHGEASIDVTGVTKLTLTYDGSYTTAVAQTLYVRNFVTGGWEQISSASVATTDQTFSWSTTNPAPYISSSGQVRLRVNGTYVSSYTCRGDLMRFTVEY